MGRPVGRPRLTDVMRDAQPEAGAVAVADAPTAATRKPITSDEAQVLCKLGMSQIQHSEKARLALRVYLEHTLEQPEISNRDADATIKILQTAVTTLHKDLCDKVLTKYLSKFDGMIPDKKA